MNGMDGPIGLDKQPGVFLNNGEGKTNAGIM